MSHRHIVITGAGTGIGRAIALRLSAGGAHLSLMARNTARLDESAARCGGETFVAQCDIRDPSSVEAAFAAAAARFGPLDGLVANSGIGGPNQTGPEDRWNDLIDTNLSGTYHCLRAAQRHLKEGPGLRHLVVISSILARIGVPGYSGYCASKAGLLGLVRSLAVELADQGVQVNAICPGWVDTQMAHEGLAGMAQGMGISQEEAYRLAMEQVPVGRMSAPKDIAGMVNWLMSDDARGVIGQAIDINGGAFLS